MSRLDGNRGREDSLTALSCSHNAHEDGARWMRAVKGHQAALSGW